MIKRALAAAAAVSLMATPALAAQADPVVPASSEVAPASETVSGMELGNGTIIGVVFALVVVAIAIWVGKDSGNDRPASP